MRFRQRVPDRGKAGLVLAILENHQRPRDFHHISSVSDADHGYPATKIAQATGFGVAQVLPMVVQGLPTQELLPAELWISILAELQHLRPSSWRLDAVAPPAAR